jgi:hypothetical protein
MVMAYPFQSVYVLSPSHEQIDGEEFKITKTLYFTRLKKVDASSRQLYFKNTYYSENNSCWLKYNNYVYFSLAFDPGSNQERYYYGKQKVL